MWSDNDNVDNFSFSPENLLRLVHHFPYKELQSIVVRDIQQMRQTLDFLLKITAADIFYTNAISMKLTLDFACQSLSSYGETFPKDVYHNLLIVFKNIIMRLSATGNLYELFPDLDVFSICKFVSEFKLFCPACANYCVSIMLSAPLLVASRYKSSFDHYSSLDKIIIEILKNFRSIPAINEVNTVSGFILLKFPLESPALQTCANWLLEDSTDVLKNLQIEEINIDHPIALCIRNMFTFFMRVRGSLKASIELKKFQDLVDKFLNILFEAAPQLIKICCVECVASNARELLAVVLQEFLSEQGILSEEIEKTTKEEINQYSTNINEWATTFTKTFFWLCHLLYYNKRFVWSTTEIAEAISRFIYNKKYMKFMNVRILKSICYIYPILLKGPKQGRKLFIIGNDLMIVASNCIPLFIRVLSLSKWQLFWFLYKGPYIIKKITLKFWIDRVTEKKIPILKQIIIDTKSESVLLDLFITALKTKSATIGRIAQILQSLHNMKLFKQIQDLIPKFRNNSEAVVALIQASCVDIPVEDKALAAKIFISICHTMDINPSNEVFINICKYAVNVLKVLKNEDTMIDSFCKNQFLLRTVISRLEVKNDMVNLAVLKFLTTLIKYQKSVCYLPENIVVDVKHLLTGTSEVVGATIAFVTQLLSGKLSINLKHENVPLILYVLYDLTNGDLSDEAYDCYFQILKSYQVSSSDVINAPVLGMLIDERCHFSNRQRQSATFLKFVLYWIKRMRLNSNKSICYLPKECTLVSFIERSSVLSESRALRYKHYISEIYAKDDKVATRMDSSLSLFDNLSISGDKK
ncbi:unnamed protein product [Ceutorhynchus assimilis]|uniref:Uncharacterized protein n=1 Tax=Ceutorhynchus assimilis TaxID=467358 RepID=A0A9N9MHM6_9CUCU|nr:unnamed protein product [Ceutorhynchus assimilis]